MSWGANAVTVMRLIEFSINGHKPVKTQSEENQKQEVSFMATYTGHSYADQMLKARNRRRQEMLIKQKLIGVLMLLITAVIVWLACSGKTPEDKDATAILLTLPLGIFLLFSRRVVIG